MPTECTEWVRVAGQNRSCSIGGVRDAVKRAEGIITTDPVLNGSG